MENIKDIKVGQKYNFTLLAIQDATEYKGAIFESPTGMRYIIKQEDYVALSPETDKKNTVSAPKYDPCRKFREGDKVRPVERYGRIRCRATYWYHQPPKTYTEAEAKAAAEAECARLNAEYRKEHNHDK